MKTDLSLKGEEKIIVKLSALFSQTDCSFVGVIQHQTEKINPETGEKMWGYLVLENKNLSREYIYRFVAYTFLGKIKDDGYHVHHITNDGNDNSVDNLILLTASEHSRVHGSKIGEWE